MIQSVVLLGTLLLLPGEIQAGGEAPDGVACIDVSKQDEQVEFVPLQFSDAEECGTPSVSALELSAKFPRQARKAFEKALNALRESQPGEAQEQLEEALTIEPNYFQASTLLAALFFNSKGYPAARLYAERAHTINHQYLPALEILGALDILDGEYPKAITELSEVVRLSPRRQAAHYYLGAALLRRGQCAEASRHLEQAADLRLHPPKPKRPLRELEPTVSPPPWAWNPRGHH